MNRRILHWVPILVAASLLSACNFAPKYKEPIVETPPQFKELTPEQTAQIEKWRAASPSDHAAHGQWWEIFGDEKLNALQTQAETTNQTIAAAIARVDAARAIEQQTRSSLFPLIGLDPSVTRSHQRLRTTANSAGVLSQNSSTFTDYTLPATASWEPDFWGRIRNSVKARKLEAEATRDDLENLRLSVHAELAVDYYEIRALDAEKEYLDSAVKAYQESLKLTRARYETGIASDQDVAQAQAQLTSTRAQATDLGIQRAQFEHAIAVLTGQAPSNFSVSRGPLLEKPPAVPVDVPASLLQRRPDIAAAQRRVIEANASIGVARAAYFPTIALSGSAGFQGASIGDLASWPNFVWSVGGSLSETIFDAGRRKGVSRQAWANYHESVANYRQTVLTSFKEVEDSLVALRLLESELRDENAAVEASHRYLALAEDRYKLGIDSYLNVIAAQTLLLGSQRTTVNLQFQQISATVQLIKSIGGDWR